MGIFSSNIKKHQALVFEASVNMLSEANRVYRNQTELFSHEFCPVTISGLGLMKALLFSVSFPIYAFYYRWESKPDVFEFVFAALSTLAAKPLLEPGASPSITMSEQLRQTGYNAILRNIKHIHQEINEGPSQPAMDNDEHTSLASLSPSEIKENCRTLGVPLDDPKSIYDLIHRGPPDGHLTTGFKGLLETCHDALQESVGSNNYSDKARREFDPMFMGNIFHSLHLLSKLLAAMK